MRPLSRAAGVILFPLCLSTNAAELPINPGLWETTMTRTNFMATEPVTETTTQCVKETSFDPGSMMKDAQGCNLVEEELNGDTLNFRMECNIQGTQGTVEGTFQTDGQTGQGNMDMTINLGEMNMSMNMEWVAQRIGDC